MTVAVAICPGTCNTRYREARQAYEQALAAYDPLDSKQTRPEPPSIQPVYGEPVWCARCAARIRQCLADLDELAALLGWVADGHSASSDAAERVSGSPEPISPSDAADTLKDLMNILSEHETAYRETVLGIGSPPRRGFLAATSSQCIAWLGHHLDSILASGAGEGFGVDVLDWYQEWKRQAKAGVRKLTKPLRCPGCRHLMLVWEEGSDRLDCHTPGCGRVFTYAEYEAETERVAAAITPGAGDSEPLASLVPRVAA